MIPWHFLIDKLDSCDPRANQCKSLVCNNKASSAELIFQGNGLPSDWCSATSLARQSISWLLALTYGIGLRPLLSSFHTEDLAAMLHERARALNLLFLLLPLQKASQLLALAPLSVATSVPLSLEYMCSC